MYTPKLYQSERDEMIDLVHENGFGILISTVANKPWATHIPMMLTADHTKLIGHISRGNKQWKEFAANEEVLGVFSGPHTYVSSSWYDHENVPTWNYLAVHIYGTIRLLSDEELYTSLKHLTDKYEKYSEKPVSVDTMSPGYVQREMKAAVGFEIQITSMEGTKKLSQNRDAVNHQAIVHQLEKSDDQQATAIAAFMKETGIKK
jgi:transcriptional regulator